MIAYKTISVRVENIGEQNMKVSQVGGEGEVGSSIHPMRRRWKGEECLPPHHYLGFILTLGGVLACHEEKKTTKRRRGWQGENHLTSRIKDKSA